MLSRSQRQKVLWRFTTAVSAVAQGRSRVRQPLMSTFFIVYNAVLCLLRDTQFNYHHAKEGVKA